MFLVVVAVFANVVPAVASFEPAVNVALHVVDELIRGCPLVVPVALVEVLGVLAPVVVPVFDAAGKETVVSVAAFVLPVVVAPVAPEVLCAAVKEVFENFLASVAVVVSQMFVAALRCSWCWHCCLA